MLPINETMGQYSELFMLLAAGTYTVPGLARPPTAACATPPNAASRPGSPSP
jgi:hypothetical protein